MNVSLNETLKLGIAITLINGVHMMIMKHCESMKQKSKVTSLY